MRNKSLLCACLGLAACMLNSSCTGSWGLLNKFSKWNMSITGNKYVNGILGIILSPVYGIVIGVDWIILNTIEFWTGRPLVAQVGTTRHMVGQDGNEYVIVTEKEGYRIENKTQGEEISMTFNEDTREWSLEQNGETRRLLRLEDNNEATVFLPSGEEKTIVMNEAGMDELRSTLAFPIPAK